MKQKLTERYVIDLMKEEWDKKIIFLIDESKSIKKNADLKVFIKVPGDGKKNVISPGLKVKKKSHDVGDKHFSLNVPDQLVYDVEDVSDKEIDLSRPSPEGDKKVLTPITIKDFEANYERK